MKTGFQLQKDDAVILGVCSGLGKVIGIDATIVRIVAVLVTIFGGFPWTLIAYGAVAWAAKPGRWGASKVSGDADSVRTRAGLDDVRDLDRRLAEVDSYVATSNSNLAREIDSLR
jgi:phage shock protein C